MRRPKGLTQARIYLVRWYSLGKRPPTFSEQIRSAGQQAWKNALSSRGQTWQVGTAGVTSSIHTPHGRSRRDGTRP